VFTFARRRWTTRDKKTKGDHQFGAATRLLSDSLLTFGRLRAALFTRWRFREASTTALVLSGALCAFASCQCL